jgi:anti-sigma regulatory factor (Ser/Thr protein kinase)
VAVKDAVIITIPSHPKYLSVVRAVTAGMAQLHEMTEAVIDDIKLAVDEACSNVIKHAYKGETSRKITLRYAAKRGTFTVLIDDNGTKLTIEQMKGRSLDDVRPGGLGVHFIRKVFDVVELDDRKRRGNRLILIKHTDKK